MMGKFPASPDTQAIRIGIFTYDFVPWEGGMGRHVMEVNRLLEGRAGLKILVFSPCKNPMANHTCLFPFTKKIGNNVLFSLLLNLRLNHLIKKYRLDMVHLHAGAGGLFLIRKIGKKCLATIHTNNYLRQFRQLRKVIKLLLSSLEKRTYRIIDEVVSVSSLIRRNVISDYRIDPEKIHTVYNGVRASVFKPDPDAVTEAETVLFVGRIDRRKGIEFLIESLEPLLDTHRDLQLLIAGDGGYRDNLMDFLAGRTIASHVRFLGWQEDGALRRLYNRATVFVLPSLGESEGFPLTLLEAMACGCPVIATDSNGSADIIRDGENGFLVPYGDKSRLSERIDRLLSSPDRREDFGRRGLACIHSGFTWEVVAERHLALYDALLQRNTSRSGCAAPNI